MQAPKYVETNLEMLRYRERYVIIESVMKDILLTK